MFVWKGNDSSAASRAILSMLPVHFFPDAGFRFVSDVVFRSWVWN